MIRDAANIKRSTIIIIIKTENKPIAPGVKPTPNSSAPKPEAPGSALPQGASPSTQYDSAGNYNPNAGHENDSNYNNTPYSGQDDAGNNVPSGPQAGMGIVTIY